MFFILYKFALISLYYLWKSLTELVSPGPPILLNNYFNLKNELPLHSRLYLVTEAKEIRLFNSRKVSRPHFTCKHCSSSYSHVRYLCICSVFHSNLLSTCFLKCILSIYLTTSPLLLSGSKIRVSIYFTFYSAFRIYSYRRWIALTSILFMIP